MLKFDVSTLCAVCYLRQQRARSGATRLPVLFVDEITSETRVVFENEEFGTFHLTFHIKLNITLDKQTYVRSLSSIRIYQYHPGGIDIDQ
jgi:hypothetical protein